jgi:hypothetical protein
MALKHLQSLVVRLAGQAGEVVTGLEGKVRAMRGSSAFLSYPVGANTRHDSPSYPLADPDVGTRNAALRAGRPECWAGVACRTLARNPREAIQSGWSRPLGEAAINRGLRQVRMPSGLFGAAFGFQPSRP